MARGWYVVHTYSGYEQKIERIINKLRSSDAEFSAYCTGVSVPMEQVPVVNDKGEKKIEMNADKTGKNPPKPLSQREHTDILRRTGEMPEEKVFRPKQDFEKGEEVKVISGPFASFNGTIDDIDLAKGRLRLSVQIFGRSTPVEVDFSQVEKVLV